MPTRSQASTPTKTSRKRRRRRPPRPLRTPRPPLPRPRLRRLPPRARRLHLHPRLHPRSEASMCGIIGYIGTRQATPILIGGLRKLEYRGYDSAGVSVFDPNGSGGMSRVVRCRGKLSALEEKLVKEPAPGTIGIGHTRWATHGRPSDENSHPHKVGPISVIHNGIIENHLALRSELIAAGAKFSSETDTEIFAHLVEHALLAGAPDLTVAVRRSLAK